MTNCNVCKGKSTRGNDSLECLMCKVVVHEKCANLPPETVTAIAQGRSTFKCKKCKAGKRASITNELPNIMTLQHKVEDLSADMHQRFEDLLRELRDENRELRKRHVELEKKNLEYDKRIHELEERVSALTFEADNRTQRENLTALEIQNIPDDVLQQDTVKLASDVMNDALDVDVNHSEIESAQLIKIGVEKKNNMLVVKFSNELVKKRIIAARRVKNKANDYRGIFLKKCHQGGARIYINERLTARRRELLKAAREWRRRLDFKFVWVDGGMIKMRRKEGERINADLLYRITEHQEY
ncbi:uncharacterized protein LOC129800918 [Phlebotomus papatasi]|uniref:uncharacterized protein LOC129800918 n=1 Tax=Phlebotomus papatasi TaxID=29031 RepID=UPI0024841E50|nr:uncharacterized protein LOC129800918 [Phlebotomus papatasi]